MRKIPHCCRLRPQSSQGLRRRARVSVPVWLAVLPDQLPVIGLVGCYPANYLIGRRPLRKRVRRPFSPSPCGNEQHGGLPLLSEGYPPLPGRLPTRYSAVRRFADGLVLRAVESACLAREYPLPAPALAGTRGTSGCHRRVHLSRSTTPQASLDLHVSGTPPAFVLGRDHARCSIALPR